MYSFILTLSPELHTHKFNCLPECLIRVLKSSYPILPLDFHSKPAFPTVFLSSVDANPIFQLVRPEISVILISPSSLIPYIQSEILSTLHSKCIQNLSSHFLLFLSFLFFSLPFPSFLSLLFLLNRALKPSGVAKQNGYLCRAVA